MRPDEQQGWPVGREPEPLPRFGRGSRNECLEVHAWSDGAHPGRIGAIQLYELIGFLARGRDEPVGLGDDLLLADHPRHRFGHITVGEQRVLHLGQRVRRVNERNTPPLAGQPADLPRQPVVRMDDVVPARLVVRLRAHHACGERTQLGRQVQLGQPFERPGGDVPHQHTGVHLEGRRLVAGRGAGEDLDLGAGVGQPLRGLDHVYVHATGVAAARRIEG